MYQMSDIVWGTNGTPTAPTAGVWSLLAARQDLLARGVYEWLTEAILNISRNFRFQALEHSGPVIQFQTNQVSYTNDSLILPADAGYVTNLIPSFVRFFNPFYGLPPVNGVNSSSTLKWKTIDALELMFNTPGIPTYFTRYGDQYMIAPVPDSIYNAYLRYQVEHPFPIISITQKPLAQPLNNFLLPNEWKQVVEYATAEIGATALRMMDYATQYHNVLYGDPQFQVSSEGRGNPGLIYRLISQMEGDSTSMMRSIRVAVASPQ